MYLSKIGRVSYVGSEQRCSAAPFLILMQSDAAPIGHGNNLRGIVRSVALRQLGHWMMGTTRIGNNTISLSGAYGQDGLPKTVPQDVWERGTPLPDDLYEAWNKGGGWNSCGSEANAMRKWALTL